MHILVVQCLVMLAIQSMPAESMQKCVMQSHDTEYNAVQVWMPAYANIMLKACNEPHSR
jgi:hypothetical protein